MDSTLLEAAMRIPKLGPVIAIDGPAGTGKSTATRRLCDALGFTHVDTGALYRAIAYLMLKTPPKLPTLISSEPVHSSDLILSEERSVEVARSAHLEFKRELGKNPANRIYANGVDVTEFIRSPEVSMAASRISAYPGVRASLLGLQRRLGCEGRSILEGRDIGTVIFPDADIKFFLTASVEERAKRRLAELEATGMDSPSFEEVKRQIMARDNADTTRTIAPLRKSKDAVEIDTSHLTLDQVVTQMEQIAQERLLRR